MITKWKFAATALAAAAIASAPMAAAARGGNGNGDGNGNKPATPPGQVISEIAKNGGGPAGVLAAQVAAKPDNPGLPKALQNVTTPTPEPTTDPTPEPTG